MEAEPTAGRAFVTGVGIGWRPEISRLIRGLTRLAWVEIIAESLPRDHLPIGLAVLADRGVHIVPHGVKVSLGSADPLEASHVNHFVRAAALTRAPVASEHIAFVRAGGTEAGHLMPLPRTREAVDVVVRNARSVASELDCPLALEPIASYVDWPDDELTEGQFVTEIIERSGCLLLLDVANVYANAVNRAQDPQQMLESLPLERIGYVHMAGGARDHAGIYHDTHAARTPPEVLELLGQLARMVPIPGVMLERDSQFPADDDLRRELDQIADAAELPRVT